MPTATEAENTRALICGPSVAVTRRCPGDETVLFGTVARTSDGAELPSSRQPM